MLRFRALASGLLLLLAMSASASEPATGSVVAIGGALRADNDAVWSRVVALAGGRGARFAVIATASGDPDGAAADTITALARHGAVAEHVRISPRLAGQDVAAAARDPAWVARIDAAQGVFFTGGEQVRLLDALQPGGVASPVLQAVRALHRRGGVVAGTSAGAAVLSEVVFRDLPDVLSALKGRLREGQEVGRGFGLVPAGVVVDQHFVKRGRIGRLLPLLAARGLPLGLGVEEDSAAVLRGTLVEVVGARGVLVIDASAAQRDAVPAAFNLRGATLSWLVGGDRYDLAARRVLPGPADRPQIDPNTAGRRGDYAGPLFFADILGDGTVVAALERLALGDQATAVGLAFSATPAADDPAPDLGFEWRFSVGPGTRAQPRSGGGGITVVEVQLAVRPVAMARPLYRPLDR